MKSLQQKLMESLTENVPAQIEQPKQLAAGDEVLVDWDGETVTCIVVSVTDEIVKVNRVIDGETVDRDYTLSQIQSLEEPIEVDVVTDITESVALTALVQRWDDMYGENFAKEYPEAFKKMKAKNSKTLTDIEAVWLDLYGEQFKDEYQGIYTALSKTLNEDGDDVDESVTEAVVNDKESFKEYAETVMKQAHGDAYDQAIVDKMVDDIAAEVGDDWGAAVGQLTSGLGEDLKALPDATSNADGIAMRTESKDLSVADYDKLSDKDKKRYVYNKETDTWMFDSTISEAVDKEDDEAKSKEYDAGFAAGEEGTLNEEDCPYEAGTDEAKDWSEGFKAGCKK